MAGEAGPADCLPQVFQTKGLRNEAVHSGDQAPVAVRLEDVCRDGDDPGLSGQVELSDRGGGFEPVHLRHLHIHKNEVVVPIGDHFNGLPAGIRHVCPLPEALEKREGDGLVDCVVLDK